MLCVRRRIKGIKGRGEFSNPQKVKTMGSGVMKMLENKSCAGQSPGCDVSSKEKKKKRRCAGKG